MSCSIELLLRRRLPTRKMCVCVRNKGAGQAGNSCDTPKMCPHQQDSNLHGFRVSIERPFSLTLCWEVCWEPKVSKSNASNVFKCLFVKCCSCWSAHIELLSFASVSTLSRIWLRPVGTQRISRSITVSFCFFICKRLRL